MCSGSSDRHDHGGRPVCKVKSWRLHLHAILASNDSFASSSARAAHLARDGWKLSEEFAQRMAPLKIVDQVLKGNSNGRSGKLNDRLWSPASGVYSVTGLSPH